MLLHIHPSTPQSRKIQQVVESLSGGGVAIVPTDTVYALVCDSSNKTAVEKLCRIKKLDPQKALLTLLCRDIAQVAEYAWQIDNQTFKLIKRNTPGPFTFILRGGRNLPKLISNRRQTIGVRIPDNHIVQAIIEQLGRPLLGTSLISDDEIREYPTDPALIHDEYQKIVDVVVDGGLGGIEASTVVDCTTEPFEIIRQGPVELVMG